MSLLLSELIDHILIMLEKEIISKEPEIMKAINNEIDELIKKLSDLKG